MNAFAKGYSREGKEVGRKSLGFKGVSEFNSALYGQLRVIKQSSGALRSFVPPSPSCTDLGSRRRISPSVDLSDGHLYAVRVPDAVPRWVISSDSLGSPASFSSPETCANIARFRTAMSSAGISVSLRPLHARQKPAGVGPARAIEHPGRTRGRRNGCLQSRKHTAGAVQTQGGRKSTHRGGPRATEIRWPVECDCRA